MAHAEKPKRPDWASICPVDTHWSKWPTVENYESEHFIQMFSYRGALDSATASHYSIFAMEVGRIASARVNEATDTLWVHYDRLIRKRFSLAEDGFSMVSYYLPFQQFILGYPRAMKPYSDRIACRSERQHPRCCIERTAESVDPASETTIIPSSWSFLTIEKKTNKIIPAADHQDPDIAFGSMPIWTIDEQKTKACWKSRFT